MPSSGRPTRAAVPRFLVGNGHDLDKAEGRGPSASSRAAWSATATPPFMSATPGP